MKRERGFYWVKDGEAWIVAEWQGDELEYWYVTGDECSHPDGWFEEIREIKLTAPDVIPKRTSIVSVITHCRNGR